MTLDINGYTSTFNTFVKFARNNVNANDEEAVAEAKKQTPVGGKEIVAVTNSLTDKVHKWKRKSAQKSLNNDTRALFKETIIEMFGGESKIPPSVKKAMLLSDYGCGKPLTARRIMLVKAAIDADGTAKARSMKAVADANNKILASIGMPDVKPSIAEALIRAMDDAGLAGIPQDEKAGFLMLNTEEGKLLQQQVFKTLPEGVAITEDHLYNCAVDVLRGIDKTKLRLNTPDSVESRFAPDGLATRRALAMGYHKTELAMLKKTAELYQSATGCTVGEAVSAALDHTSPARRLISYGERFAESVENFANGLRLLNSFKGWYNQVAADIRNDHRTTMTTANAQRSAMIDMKTAAEGFEKFVFEEIAVNKSIDLSSENLDDVFGIEKNGAIRFLGRGFASGVTGTYLQIPPAKRTLIHDVFDQIVPLREIGDKSALLEGGCSGEIFGTILRHYDELQKLKEAGDLDRAHIFQTLFPDLNLPDDATSSQISQAIKAKTKELGVPPEASSKVTEMMVEYGCTVTEAVKALENNQKLPKIPYYSNFSPKIYHLTADAKKTCGQQMSGDIIRPEMPFLSSTKKPAIKPENNRFVFKIGGETIPMATGLMENPDVKAAADKILDKIESFVGKMHQPQLNAVYMALTQSAYSPFTNNMEKLGIMQFSAGAEHAPLTYTLSKNEETGAVTIRYSEPEGFPKHFHWETTIGLDGTSTTTPFVITE
ncbi:MAG: hypothetical protein J6T46_13810 [Victivallales bacterium]|nr:hypothetical protein [Victivallales bacterium]MBO7620353.1 hypothetical protein [Victivallales bacterium]